MSYDVVINNGTVVDGAGTAHYQADVAIADGKVTEGAKRTIDPDEGASALPRSRAVPLHQNEGIL